MTKLEFHPVADLFPLMHGAAFATLVADVREHGLLEPIWLHPDGRIIDGRNRYLACIEAGVEPKTRTYTGSDEDLLDFVISMNLHRRHLNESQRGMVGARLATLQWGGRESSAKGQICTSAETIPEAAARLNVSPRTVKDARKVLERGSAKLIDAAEQGEVAVSDAATVVGETHDVQDKLLAAVRGDEASHLRDAKCIAEIAKRDAELADTSLPLPDGTFPVIYADPPWRFANPAIGGHSTEKHYPTMPLAEICALPVSEIAADDAILYLWVPNAMLPEALKVIEAWGFEYRSCMVWVKDKIGRGYWVRNRHETLLIAKRGNFSPPYSKHRSDSVVEAPLGKHSAKPHRFYEIIERSHPGFPRIELFCRTPRKGWAVWGNEVTANAA